jgi:tetratricopeptide (TPR) repeat protein
MKNFENRPTISPQLVAQFEKIMRDKDMIFLDELHLKELIFCYTELGKIDIALQAINYALYFHSSSSDFWVYKAIFLIKEYEYKPALALLNKAQLLAPFDTDICIKKAFIYQQLGLPNKAANLLKQCIKTASTSSKPNLYIALSDVYKSGDQWKKSFKALALAVSIDPDDEETLRMLNYVGYRANMFTQCANVFKVITIENPLSRVAWFYYGSALGQLGQLTQALDALENAIAIDENFEAAIYNAGIASFKLKQHSNALQYFTEIIERTNDFDEELYYYAGLCAIQLNLTETAHDFLTKIVRINEEYYEAWYQLGELYYTQLHQVQKAIFYYKQAAKYSHNNSQIWSKLAEVYMAEKQFSDALAAFREAILINDQHVTNYIGLAKICLEVEAYTEAENVMTLAFANLKDPPAEIWYMASAVQYLSGNKQHAQQIYQMAKHHFPTQKHLIQNYLPKAYSSDYFL